VLSVGFHAGRLTHCEKRFTDNVDMD
jgi:hypothetical protein